MINTRDVALALSSATDKLTISKSHRRKEKKEADMQALRDYVAGTDAYPISHEKYQKGANKLSPYKQAKEGTGSILMGREKDTWPYRSPEVYYEHYVGRVSNCEEEGVTWTLQWNMAFWLGGIEALREFQFVTSPETILKRAKEGFKELEKGSTAPGADLGGAFPEVFWLLDNDYQLAYRKGDVFALPPKTLHNPVFINPNYEKNCLGIKPLCPHPFSQKQIKQLFTRLEEECEQLKKSRPLESKQMIPSYRSSPYNTLLKDSLYLSKLGGSTSGSSTKYVPPFKRNLVKPTTPDLKSDSLSNWRKGPGSGTI